MQKVLTVKIDEADVKAFRVFANLRNATINSLFSDMLESKLFAIDLKDDEIVRLADCLGMKDQLAWLTGWVAQKKLERKIKSQMPPAIVGEINEQGEMINARTLE